MMTGRLLSTLASLIVLASPLPGLAQVNLASLNNRLQLAVSSQQWAEAIRIVDQMIIAAPDRAKELQGYRSQLSKLQAAGVRVPVPSTPATFTEPSGSSGSSQSLGAATIKRRQNGIPVVEVRMNNRLSFEMLVDSGASITVITRPMAAALGITPAQIIDRAVFSTANGKTTMPIVYINSIEVAGLSKSMLPVAVAGPEMEIGLLGQDFLQRFDVSFRHKVIEFHPR